MSSINQPKAISTSSTKFPELDIPVSYVELHSPIRFEGRTETNVSIHKIPSLKLAAWNKEGTLITILGAKERHILPAAAVKDSIV